MDDEDDQQWNYFMLFAATAVVGGFVATRAKKPRPRSTELSGKRFVVTGANSGIGLATAKELYQRGAEVIAAVRDPSTISDKDGFAKVVALDLSNLKTIAEAVKEIPKPVTCLVNNAGAMHKSFEEKNGVEKTMMTNFLGPLYFTEKLRANRNKVDLRVVNVGSKLANKSDLGAAINAQDLRGSRDDNYSMWKAYSNSKYLSLLASQHMSNEGADVFTVTPGVCNTRLNRWVNPMILALSWPLRAALLNSPEKGASAVVYAAAREKGGSGHVIYDSNQPKAASNEDLFGEWQIKKPLDAELSARVHKMALDLLLEMEKAKGQK